MMQATLKFWQNGMPTGESLLCPLSVTERPKHKASASGYGGKIPTEYLIKYKGRWRRVYAACYSNCGTLYIGTLGDPWTATVEIDSQ